MATALILDPPRQFSKHVSDEDLPYEVIDGIRVELPPVSFYAKRLATVFSFHLEK